MEGFSMSSTMLMVTMAVPSWRSSMMGKHTILRTMDMDMEVKYDGEAHHPE